MSFVYFIKDFQTAEKLGFDVKKTRAGEYYSAFSDYVTIFKGVS